MLPLWMQLVLGLSAFVMAVGVLWQKVLRPLIRGVALSEEILPLIRDLHVAFRDTPYAFAILDEIVAQFRTNAGSSLRDVIDRLDEALTENRASAEVLKVNLLATRELAAQDRQQLAAVVARLDAIIAKVDLGAASGARIELSNDRLESAGARIESSGVRMEHTAEGVADELAAAQLRADETVGEPGAAADAGLRSANGDST